MVPPFFGAAALPQSAQLIQPHYNITIQPTPPQNALEVPADFFGWGFESGLLPAYDNDLSDNIVESIASRMSKPLVIRVGGTSGDNIIFNKDQTNGTYCNSDKHCNNLDTYYAGPSYFDAMKRFPNAAMTIQAPMGDNINMDNTIAFLKEAWNVRGKDKIAAIELGNEPNWYKKYGVDGYIKLALEIEDRATKELPIEDDAEPIFQVGEIASEKVRSPDYNLMDVINGGINDNGRIKWAAEHFYQFQEKHLDKNKYNDKLIQQSIMSHDEIVKRLEPYKEDADDLRANPKNPPLVISELGSSLGHAPPGFAGGFGAAMWAVDWHLAAMSRGVQRAGSVQQPSATHAYWIPNNHGPHGTGPAVQGIFPSAAFITDFVGKDDSLGKVTEIDIKDAPFFSAYAMYNLKTNEPQRIALINLHEWHTGSILPRSNTTVTLAVPGEVPSITVRRMQSLSGSRARGLDLGGPQENVTWAGEQWAFSVPTDLGKGHFPHGQIEEKIDVCDGKVDVVVPDTEAVIVDLPCTSVP